MKEKTSKTFLLMQEYLIHIYIHLNINLFLCELMQFENDSVSCKCPYNFVSGTLQLPVGGCVLKFFASLLDVN